jgi:acid phosphatase (class A)
MVVNDGDDIVEAFKPLIEKFEVNISDEYLTQIKKESSKFIHKLKYHYNRPRPYQVAKFYNMDLNGVELESMKTPSYPSGHAVQGYLFGEILSRFNPENATEYRRVGEDIAHSRIVAKAHYPSDKEYGKKISKVLFTGIKKWSV